jgi:RNA polymerase sigma-70 factor (ECF subfamily)
VERIQKEVAEAAQSLDFSAIYERWFEEVSRWVRAMGGPDAEREDLVQDVFVVVHRRLQDFDGENVAGWLYQIARRRVRDFLRLAWVKHLLKGSVPITEGLMEMGASPAEALETKEKRDLLEALLEKLNESERAALVLFELDGLSGEQIATLQGVPVSAVWVRIHKARKKLKLSLEKFDRKSKFRT